MDFKILCKKILVPFYILRYRIFHFKKWFYIGPHCKINNTSNIFLGEGAQIAGYSMLHCLYKKSKITIYNNVYLGMFSRIGCANSVTIEDNVLTGPHIFISDYNHAYENINLPVVSQGVACGKNDRVIIGKDSWIGTNVCIIGNIKIGKHCIIGANSVVTKDLPDFSVAVGSPARVIKQYNPILKKWVKVSDQ